jgi:hypothetical protein
MGTWLVKVLALIVVLILPTTTGALTLKAFKLSVGELFGR